MNKWLLQTTPDWFYPHQTKLFEFIEKNDRVVAKKYRQGGFTTALLYWAYTRALQGESIAFLSHWGSGSRMNHNMLAYEKLFFNKNQTSKMTDRTIQFKSGGSIYFRSAWEARGLNCKHIILDEAAFFKWIDITQEVTIDQCEGKVIACSTPNGINRIELLLDSVRKELDSATPTLEKIRLTFNHLNWFYDTYTIAENNAKWMAKRYYSRVKPNCKFKRISFDAAEFYSKERLEEIRKNLGDFSFRQEFLGEFLMKNI